MTTAKCFEAGPSENWKQWEFEHPQLRSKTPGKLLLGERLGLCGMEVSLNFMPPGKGMPFAHRHHENEELYVFLQGHGELKVDEQFFALQPGTCIQVPPEGSRAWRCTGEEPLIYIVVQASAGGKVRGIDDGALTEYPVVWQARADDGVEDQP
ncbi:MAG: cupin protein [Myxococcaceae bacterium]|nr:cupin protein [Myxococcaceae bacterium]